MIVLPSAGMNPSQEKLSISSESSLPLRTSLDNTLSPTEEKTKAAASLLLESMPLLESPNNSLKKEGEKEENRSHLIEKLKIFHQSLTEFEKNYEKLQISFESEIEKGLAGAEYLDQNSGNIRAVLNSSAPPEISEVGSGWIKQFGKIFKLLDHTCPLFINLLKYYIISNRYSQLIERIEGLKKLTPSSTASDEEKILHSNIVKQIEKNHSRMRCKLHELEPNISLKFVKLVSRLSTYPLEYIGVIHKDASHLSKSFLEVFRGIIGFYLINQSFKIEEELNFQLQPDILIDKRDESPPPASEKNWRPDRNRHFETITDFKRELLSCPHLDAVRSWLKEPSIRISFKDDLNYLNTASSLSEVRKRLSNEVLIEECSLFLRSLERCKNLDNVITLLNEKKMTTIEIPSNFERWQSQMKDVKFRRHLEQIYFTVKRKRPYETSFQDLLRKRKKEREDKIEKARKTFIEQQIQECNGKNFTSIVDHFKKLNIHFDRMQPNPDPQKWVAQPKSEKDWIALVASPAFCSALAEQWVDHQATIAQLTEQSIRQTLLSKLSVETQFLNFRWIECYVRVVSGLVQLFFLWQQAIFPIISSFVQLLNTDIRKMDITGVGIFNLFYPLYPDLSFKSDGLIMLLIEHFFAYKYKPQEYSFEAYKLSMQIRIYELQALALYFLSIFKCLSLRLKIIVIENAIQRKKAQPFEEDCRKKQYEKEYEASRIEMKDNIEKCQKRLIELKLLDAKKIISPHSPNHQTADPLDILAESLDQLDNDHQPSSLKELFHKTLGLDLSNQNKGKFKKKMEEFLVKGEVRMMDHYQSNRLIYLRS